MNAYLKLFTFETPLAIIHMYTTNKKPVMPVYVAKREQGMNSDSGINTVLARSWDG